MGFDFTRPEYQEIIVEGNSNSQIVKFVGRFIALDSDDERGAIESRIEQVLNERDENGESIASKAAFRRVTRDVAADIFLGWENNPDGDPDLWVTEEGEAIDCNKERRMKMINTPGLAIAIITAFADEEFNIKGSVAKSNEARLGNFERSRGNGFRSKIAQATPRKT